MRKFRTYIRTRQCNLHRYQYRFNINNPLAELKYQYSEDKKVVHIIDLSLSMTSQSLGIDSEAYLFSILKGYKKEFPNLISRRQYNDRRKFTRNLCETIRKRMADSIDGGEDYFCIEKPIEVCRVARGKRCTMGKNDYSKAPSFGYCASQKTHYYGYKLHVLCGLSGVIHSYDLTKASVHDINYLQDIKLTYHDCSILVIEDILTRKYNWTYLKVQTLNWNALID